MKSKHFWEKISTASIMGISGLILVVTMLILGFMPEGGISRKTGSLLILLSFLQFSLTGIPIIIRKEFPFYNLDEKFAVFLGYVLLLSGIGFIYFIIKLY